MPYLYKLVAHREKVSSLHSETMLRGASFDREDLSLFLRELRTARDRVQVFEQHALNRLIDELERAMR